MISIFIPIFLIAANALSATVTPAQERVIYSNGNIYTVYNRPTKATSFSIQQPMIVTSINNYHWNTLRARGRERSRFAMLVEGCSAHGRQPDLRE